MRFKNQDIHISIFLITAMVLNKNWKKEIKSSLGSEKWWNSIDKQWNVGSVTLALLDHWSTGIWTCYRSSVSRWIQFWCQVICQVVCIPMFKSAKPGILLKPMGAKPLM